MPIAVGFGISNPEQAEARGPSTAKPCVVGSAVVNQIAEHGKSPELVGQSRRVRESRGGCGEIYLHELIRIHHGSKIPVHRVIVKGYTQNQDRHKDRFVIIMAGGRGERFWPVSREKTPKQLIKLLGDRSFLQEAVDRVLPLVPMKNIFIITNEAQAAEVRKQLPKLPKENVVAEPVGRDTCAAVTLGAALVGARSTTGVMAVLPADHVIPEAKKFQQVLADAFDLAGRGQAIVTIGIKPTEPATGYGYIRVGDAVAAARRREGIQDRLSSRRAVRREAELRHGAGISAKRPVSLERRHVRLVVRDRHRRVAETSAGDVRRVPALVQGGEPTPPSSPRCWPRNIPRSKKSRLITR